MEHHGVVEVGLVEIADSLEKGTSSGQVGKLMSRTDLTQQQQMELQALQTKWTKVFAVDGEDFGRTDLVQHCIHTGNAVLVKERYQTLLPLMYRR